MTGLQQPTLSPTAGLFNALVRLHIARLRARIAELQAGIEAEHAAATSRNFADSAAHGYINRTGLEGP